MAPLITVGDLEAYLQRSVPAPAANLAVAGASGAVRAHCGWGIAQEVGVRLTVTGQGSRVLGLPTLHLTAVDEVRIDGEVVDADTYKWARRGQLYRDEPWPQWATVEADVDHGYDPIPDVVKIVALAMAARYVTNPELAKVAAVGSLSRTYFDTTPLDARLLSEYTLP